MINRIAAALCCVVWAISCYAQTTAIRPDQISPATPDITWTPGGTGYQIGSTVAWRTSNSASPTFSPSDGARIVELTASGPITASLPDTTTTGFGDGFGFTIQVGPGTLTLNRTSTSQINNQTSITISPYQSVVLVSKGGNWYAAASTVPPASGAPAGCTQATTFLNAVAALPATLDTTHTNAYTVLICGLVSDGIWAAFDALWVPATNTVTGTNTAVADLNLANPSKYTLVLHGATLTADAGYGGGTDGGTTVYIDTGYNPTAAAGAYTTNSAHVMVWNVSTYGKSSGYGQIVGGLGPAGNGTAIIPFATSGNMLASTNYTSNTTQYTVSGIWGGGLMETRTGALASNEAIYHNGVALTPLAFGPYVPVGMPNANMYLLAGNNNNTGMQNGSGYQVSAASFGSGLNATQISSLGSTPVTSANAAGATGLMPRICAYLTSVHSSC